MAVSGDIFISVWSVVSIILSFSIRPVINKWKNFSHGSPLSKLAGTILPPVLPFLFGLIGGILWIWWYVPCQ